MRISLKIVLVLMILAISTSGIILKYFINVYYILNLLISLLIYILCCLQVTLLNFVYYRFADNFIDYYEHIFVFFRCFEWFYWFVLRLTLCLSGNTLLYPFDPTFRCWWYQSSTDFLLIIGIWSSLVDFIEKVVNFLPNIYTFMHPG